MTGIHGIQRHGPAGEHASGEAGGKKADSRDIEAFSSALKGDRDGKDAQGAGAAGTENEPDMRELLAEAKKSFHSTIARAMQQNAKDIERDNIDRGL